MDFHAGQQFTERFVLDAEVVETPGQGLHFEQHGITWAICTGTWLPSGN